MITNLKTTTILPTTKWENYLVFSPNPDYWEQIRNNTFSMTTNTNLQLIQYKVIHRSHITQTKMFKMGLANTDISSQCTSDDYLHAMWLCQLVYSFCITITEALSTILDSRIPSSQTLCLLNDISKINIKQHFKNLLLISLAVAKKVVLQNWKSKKSCHINHWKNLITEYITIENHHAYIAYKANVSL